MAFFKAHRKRRQGSYCILIIVLAGAVGNIIDGTLYGILFSESYRQLATFLPEAGGYAPLFFGAVDMFYFPIFKGYLPE